MGVGYYTDIKLDGIGKIWIAKTLRGISRIGFAGNEHRFLRNLEPDLEWRKDRTPFRSAILKFERLAKGKKVEFEKCLDLLTGTPFQRRVWKAISSIPYGETRSYAWLAKKAGRPAAVRAAASACGANPVPIIIPCHRVIASNGTIGGFSCGTVLKKKLLKIEMGLFHP